jgi:phosphopantothenoylcysteine decarboxylase/phosphopantothenate--cysteine ligase
MPRVLFALSGSISCYKACHAISRLVQAKVEVQTVVTAGALRFIGAATLEGLTGRAPFVDLWTPGRAMDHIDVTRWADLAVLAPASANTLNRLSAGLADDPLGALFLAWELKSKPWWVAPAMNSAMLAHPATQASLAKLAAMGVRVLPTEDGTLACGEVGPGRLLDPDTLVRHILVELGTKIA